MAKLDWKDAFDIKPSKNTRGEDTYDVYRKGTDVMIAADVLATEVDKFLEEMVKMGDRHATEELEALLGNDTPTPSNEPAEAEYIRTRQFGGPVAWVEDDEQ